MKQKKPTPKKKSASSSPLLTQPRKEGVRVFDLIGAKLVGQVVQENKDGVVFDLPCTLETSIEPVKGGESFTVKVAFRPMTLVGRRYLVYKSAIRGETYLYDDAIKAGYAEFRQRAERGDYELGPYRPIPEVVYSQGSGEEVKEDLGTLSSTKEPGDAHG